MSATICVREDDLIQHLDGEFTMRVPNANGREQILSVQKDGSPGKHDRYNPDGSEYFGPFEKGARVGNKILLSDSGYPTGHFAVLILG